MSKKKKFIIYIIVLIIVCAALVIKNVVEVNNDQKMTNVVLITNDKHDEDTMLLKKGAEQAAGEFNVDLKVVCLSGKNNVDEQIKAINSESSNDIDCFIIEPSDYTRIGKQIKILNEKKTVITLINKTSCSYASLVSNDNYDMGKKLGEDIIKRNKSKNTITIVNNEVISTSCKERLNGFMETIKMYDKCVYFYNFQVNNIDHYYDSSKKFLLSNKSDIVVTFDKNILEALGEAKKDISDKHNINTPSARIYGSGSSNKIISLMENKYIDAVVTENKYDLGYLSVHTAVDVMNNKKKKDCFVRSKVINNDNMYSDENQQVLFEF